LLRLLSLLVLSPLLFLILLFGLAVAVNVFFPLVFPSGVSLTTFVILIGVGFAVYCILEILLEMDLLFHAEGRSGSHRRSGWGSEPCGGASRP